MKTSIVIQGPTNYCKKVLESPISKRDIVWSTWMDEPEKNAEFIRSKNIFTIFNNIPLISGIMNVNLQAKSAYEGTGYSIGDFIFKTRGDIMWKGLDRLIDILEKEYNGNMMFLCYQNDAQPNYIADFFSFGTREESLLFWDYQGQNNDFRNPETQLFSNYCEKKRWQSIENGLQNTKFFLKHLIKNEIDPFWLKYPDKDDKGNLKSFADWKNVGYIKYD